MALKRRDRRGRPRGHTLCRRGAIRDAHLPGERGLLECRILSALYERCAIHCLYQSGLVVPEDELLDEGVCLRAAYVRLVPLISGEVGSDTHRDRPIGSDFVARTVDESVGPVALLVNDSCPLATDVPPGRGGLAREALNAAKRCILYHTLASTTRFKQRPRTCIVTEASPSALCRVIEEVDALTFGTKVRRDAIVIPDVYDHLYASIRHVGGKLGEEHHRPAKVS